MQVLYLCPLFNYKSMARNPIGFSGTTFGFTSRVHIKKVILESIESNREYRDEIRRVFQMANRRIQNIEQKESLSPAVMALNKGDIKGFTKFSMKHNWEDLKIEYAKAVSFLQQPTSTATGTKEYQEHLKKSYDLTDDEFDIMKDNLMGKIASISDERFLEQYLMQYKDFTGELESEAHDVSDQIESEAERLAQALDDAVENEVTNVQQAIGKNAQALNKIMESFKNFGL